MANPWQFGQGQRDWFGGNSGGFGVGILPQFGEPTNPPVGPSPGTPTPSDPGAGTSGSPWGTAPARPDTNSGGESPTAGPGNNQGGGNLAANNPEAFSSIQDALSTFSNPGGRLSSAIGAPTFGLGINANVDPVGTVANRGLGMATGMVPGLGLAQQAAGVVASMMGRDANAMNMETDPALGPVNTPMLAHHDFLASLPNNNQSALTGLLGPINQNPDRSDPNSPRTETAPPQAPTPPDAPPEAPDTSPNAGVAPDTGQTSAGVTAGSPDGAAAGDTGGFRSGGMVVGQSSRLPSLKSKGGPVNAGKPGSVVDDVPVKLQRGEMVVNRNATQQFKPALRAMNQVGRNGMNVQSPGKPGVLRPK